MVSLGLGQPICRLHSHKNANMMLKWRIQTEDTTKCRRWKKSQNVYHTIMNSKLFMSASTSSLSLLVVDNFF
jgi:hypothetical protein